MKYKTYSKTIPTNEIKELLKDSTKNHTKITSQELNELVDKYQKNPTTKVKHDIYNHISPLIVRLSSHYSFQNDLVGDSISEVYLSFESALKSYNINKGLNFTSLIMLMSQSVSKKLNEVNSGMSQTQYVVKRKYDKEIEGGATKEEAFGTTKEKFKINDSTTKKAITFSVKNISALRSENDENGAIDFFESYVGDESDYKNKAENVKKFICAVIDAYDFPPTQQKRKMDLKDIMIAYIDGLRLNYICEIYGWSTQLINTKVKFFKEIAIKFVQENPLSKDIIEGHEIFYHKFPKYKLQRKVKQKKVLSV